VLGRLLLQADTRRPIPVNTPCSLPLCAGLRSSVTHGIGTVTDIPHQPYDLYIYRCRAGFEKWWGTLECMAEASSDGL